jgi:hypothetical protein
VHEHGELVMLMMRKLMSVACSKRLNNICNASTTTLQKTLKTQVTKLVSTNYCNRCKSTSIMLVIISFMLALIIIQC